MPATLQAVFFFLSLSRCSLPVVLSWVTIVPHLIQAVLDVQLNKSQIRPARLAGLLLGILATGGCPRTGLLFLQALFAALWLLGSLALLRRTGRTARDMAALAKHTMRGTASGACPGSPPAQPYWT
jgi:hypothetical protein